MSHCAQCTQQFEITKEDLVFYDKVSPIFNGKKHPIPAPTHCPDCRRQRRLTFRNERKLYNRKCDLCQKQMISMFSPDKPNTVYCINCFYGDGWDPLQYGLEIDFNKPIFEQINQLIQKTPLPSLIGTPDMEDYNCAFVNYAGNNKNCYMIFDSDFNDESYFSNVIKHSTNCIDCSYVQNSELCYECVDCDKCYNLAYSQDCTNCTDGYFLKNCVGCKNCAFSSNLVRKEFYIFNKPYSKEEYFKILKDFNLNSRPAISDSERKFIEHKLKYPQKFSHSINVENCSGDYINNSKNCKDCYNIAYSEDLKYCDSLYSAKDCYDVSSFGEKIQMIYESGTIGLNAYQILFSHDCVDGSNDIMYSLYNHHSQNLFGSVSLVRKKHCILNKQYSKEEYDNLVPKIIEHMIKTGEWGEYFPISMSPFGYNETMAFEQFPIKKDAALENSFNWKNEETSNQYQGPNISIPETVADVPDEITKQILTCSDCDKNYKIISQELDFYRKKDIPAPDKCLNCRHKKRMSLRNGQTLFNRKCSQCNTEIQTTYSPDLPEKVYCEQCYLKEVY